MLSYIIIGLIFKTIGNDDIEYCDGKIHAINHFEFSKNHYVITKNILNYDTGGAIQQSQPKKKMIDSWEKYVANFKKIRPFK